MGNIWNNEEISKDLAAKIAAGSSYRIVAEELSAKYGITITRNSCMGRADRLGIESPRRSGETDESKKPKYVRKLRIVTNGSGPTLIETRTAADRPKLRCVEIVPRHLSLMDLEPNDCRYPYSGDVEGNPITFCGHQRARKILGGIEVLQSYCAPHADLCMVVPKPPKERGYVLRARAAS